MSKYHMLSEDNHSIDELHQNQDQDRRATEGQNININRVLNGRLNNHDLINPTDTSRQDSIDSDNSSTLICHCFIGFLTLLTFLNSYPFALQI